MGNIEEAITVLEQHIVEIHTVPEWAERVGFISSEYFSRKIRSQFHKTAYQLIVDKKLECIKKKLCTCSDEVFFCIALEVGFVDNASL